MSLEDKLQGLGCLAVPVLMIGGGFVGAFVGMGAGYLLGNVVDFIPFMNKIAPAVAEYVGFQQSLDMNENFYQLSMGVAGAYKGSFGILKFLTSD